jgi:O-antigen/teichoic acid export membrane protein
MTKSASLAKNTILIGISKISTNIITFLMLPVYTTLLSTSEYGIVDLVITYGGLLAPLIMLNMEMAVFRHLIDVRSDREAQKRIITNAVSLVFKASIAAGLLYIVAAFIWDIPMAALLALYFFSTAMGSLVIQIARGLGRLVAFVVGGVAQGLLAVIFNVIFVAVFGMGASGMLLGMSLGALIPAIILVFMLRLDRHVRPSARDRATSRELLSYALPLIPNSISWWVFNASDRTIISIVISAAANGIYAVSNKISGVLNSIWGVFYMSWTESAAININSPDRDKFFSSTANLSLKVFASLALGSIAISPLAFPFLVSGDFSEALLYIPLLMLAALANCIMGFYSAIYIAKKLTKQVMNTSIIAAVISLVTTLSLIWFIGIWAAAISTTVAYGVNAIYRHYDMKKYVKITYQPRIFIIIAAAFAVVTTLYYINNFWLNLANLAFAGLVALLLNRNLIARGFDFACSYLRKPRHKSTKK